MKYFFILFFALFLSAGCKDHKSSETELENKLMQTMQDYLDKNSKGITFTIKDVSFGERQSNYYCEFHVNMRSTGKDTTGTMVALISKDFSSVERSQ